MNNKIVHGVVFGLLGCSGMMFGMELDKSKQAHKDAFFSLIVKKNGPCTIKKCTIDDAEAKTIMVRELGSAHKLVTTRPVCYEKIKQVEDINFSMLGPLLDKREKFVIEIQTTDHNKEKYVIDQVNVKSWPIQFDEIRNGKYGSIGKYLTSDSVVYDLQDDKSTQLPVLRCANSEPYEYQLLETFSSVALIAMVFFYWKKNPMVFTYVANSLK